MFGPENGNFSLLFVIKMFLRSTVSGSKKPQNTLHNVKMVPKSVLIHLHQSINQNWET